MSRPDKKILEKLFGLTEHVSPVANSRICAGVVYKGKLISVGFNRRKTHPLQKKFGKNQDAIFLHAEIDAIIQARRELTLDELSKSVLYIIRRKKKLFKDWNGKLSKMDSWGLAKPCPGCQKCIDTYGISQVVYSTNEYGKYES